jgi:hypothetical protein
MKKLLVVFTVFTLSVIGVQAQSKDQTFTFGGGVHLALPTGNFGDGWSFGLGVQLQGEYKFADNVTGVGTIGYSSFFGKTQTFPDGTGGTISAKTPSVGLIPILVGARFYPSESFFIGAQIGYGVFTNTGGGSGSSGFDYYPQIGYNTSMFQFILGYNAVSVTGGTLAHVGLTGIYKFGGN